jgi:hypothetical protein
LAYAKWKEVEKLANIRQLGVTEHEKRKTNIRLESMRDSLVDINKSEMLEEIRFQFTRYLKKVYW